MKYNKPKKTNNWKSLGMDKVPNYWMIDCLHLDLTDSLNKPIRSPENLPEWIAQGTTYLLPKSENTKEPRNYRPTTCLATMYKLLTSIISERTYTFLEDQQLLPTEQKGVEEDPMDVRTNYL